ncbi:hypothetical protein ISS08_02350 [Candidatus Pacearchaeota archaeon]|nr:hypothetical protein [Candidatus Pacearchaeota archaeon]
MSDKRKFTVDEVLQKYSGKIEGQIKTSGVPKSDYSSQYVKFKKEMAPDISRYERWASSLGSFIRLKVSEKDEEKIKKQLDIAHLDIEPWQSLTLAVMAFATVFMIGLLGSVAVVLIDGSIEAFPALFFFLMVVLSLFLFYFVSGYPTRLANKWRLKASSQMVPAILYIVVYMRHTPNLEKAVAFAAEHLQEPLSLDFKKVFYNVEVGKFSTIKESLDEYLDGWRDYSIEFIEAFHLIENSLFEPDTGRRITTLEKSLQVVLDGVYDKMLKFTHNVRAPITNVYMLGVVLPTLGLALLPLASAMLGGIIQWYHIFILFNLIIPFLVFYLTDQVLLLRPGGYGESSLLERNPLYAKYRDNSVYSKYFLIVLPLIILGLLPLIFQFTPLPSLLGLQTDYTFAELGLSYFGDEPFFGFITLEDGSVMGPFGAGALILSMLIPLGVALFFSMAFKEKTKDLIKERDKTKQLESEFNNSLFQLGNRLGNGVPPELAFGKVAESSKGLMTEDFFRRVNYNIRQMGMGIQKAIFDPQRGAISYYPSDLISTSMRILIESSKKGLKIAAVSLMNISEYVKNIKKITIRLNDMLAEIISDMKSNMTFLAPLLSGIVIGLSAMITSILSKLKMGDPGTQAALGGMAAVVDIFDISAMIPPYYLQLSIGLYLIQIIFILTSTLVTINSGEDQLQKTHRTASNLKKGVGLYFIIAAGATLALFVLTTVVLGNALS